MQTDIDWLADRWVPGSEPSVSLYSHSVPPGFLVAERWKWGGEQFCFEREVKGVERTKRGEDFAAATEWGPASGANPRQGDSESGHCFQDTEIKGESISDLASAFC